MGGFITMDKDLEEDPRIDDLGHALYEIMGGRYREEDEAADDGDASQRRPADERLFGVCRDAVLGGLYKLWRHGDAFLGRHNRLKGVSHGAARIAKIMSLPLSLVRLVPAEWLKIHPDGSVELPDYAEKNRLHNRDIRRSNGRERTAKWRANRRAEKSNGDASHGVTSEGEKRHGDAPTGTGTGTNPDRTIQTGLGVGGGAQLASAQGRLAGRKDPERAPKVHRKSERELEADAHKLAAAGMSIDDIVRTLRQHEVTTHQVTAWISNLPPTAKAS
jgi:hypothetical protein